MSTAASGGGRLRWRRAAAQDWLTRQQVVLITDGRDVQYKIARSGTVDKPTWTLYTRSADAVEHQLLVSNRLRYLKHYAQALETK